MDNFQRTGSISNAHVGREFEKIAQVFFSDQGIDLKIHHLIPVGIEAEKKNHAFDLGSEAPKIIVECKSHTWTSGNNVPSAKMTVWNEAMFYFSVAPPEYRKIFFVLRDESAGRGETLAEYYIRTYGHLIPSDVEIWEYDSDQNSGKLLQKASNTAPKPTQ